MAARSAPYDGSSTTASRRRAAQAEGGDGCTDQAAEEGVQFMEGYSPKAYTGRVNTLEGIDFVKVTDFGKDENGKITFKTDDSQLVHLPVSFCIVAIGQYADNIYPAADGEKVFYAGDIAGGACSVIDALASGRKAAFAVDAAMQERTLRQADTAHGLINAPTRRCATSAPWRMRKPA